MNPGEFRDLMLSVLEDVFAAQLKTVRRLRAGGEEEKPQRRRPGSQVDLVEDVLTREGAPLHVNDILEKIREVHGQSLDRDSLVSALTKRVQKGERFIRAAKNTFGLKRRV